MLTVLYDGWPLLYQPYGPAAQHLLAILATLPEQVQAWVALPGDPPDWLPPVATRLAPVANTPFGRLAWEQRLLPGLARRLDAHLLHHTTLGAPLLGHPISVASPAEYLPTAPPGPPAARGLAERLRTSLARGGLARLRGLFWPADLPPPGLPLTVYNLPPAVHPAFHAGAYPAGNGAQPPPASLAADEPGQSLPDLPEAYVLYQGPAGTGDLHRLLAAWSWATEAIGGDHPLLLAGLELAQERRLHQLLPEYDINGTVLALSGISPVGLPVVYRRCTAFFSPAPRAAWGGPARHALACGKPVVAVEDRLSDALFGPAAYLVPPGDGRALGAALIAVVVEEALAESLSRAARQRAATWTTGDFGLKLWEAYQAVLSAPRRVA